MLTNTALLFFTRTAASEAVNKAIVSRCNNNRKLSSLLIENSRQNAKAARLPVYEINEHQQVGNKFGEKLANAMEVVFTDGFENVIVIGNDCPQLTSTIINNASFQLKENELVVGPDNHGGVYLIGISKKIFNKQQVASLQWQTPDLAKDLMSSFNTVSSCQLSVLNDLNSFSDLFIIKSVLSFYNKIRAFVLSIIASINRKVFQTNSTYTNLLFFAEGLRAPPCYK